MSLQLFKTQTGETALVVNGHLILDGDSDDDSAKLVEQTGERLATALDMGLVVQNVHTDSGHWEWADLIALGNAPTKSVCQQCGGRLHGGLCIDLSCPYSDWPQSVSLSDLETYPVVEIIERYGLIRAEVHSDDWNAEAKFYANAWFVEADPERILCLADEDWKFCEEADSVARSAEDMQAVSGVFDYVNIRNQSGLTQSVGFGCSINRDDAMRWLRQQRYGLWCQIICQENSVRIVEAQEPEVAGMYDWIGNHGNACEMSFDSPDLAAVNAVEQLGLDESPSVTPLYQAYWDISSFCTPSSNYRIQGIAMFGEAHGYTTQDTSRISALKPGQIWTSPDYGDGHVVTRIR